MQKLDYITKKLGFAAILFFPLEIYRISFPFINLSLFRICLLAMFALFICRLFMVQKLAKSSLNIGLYLLLLAIFGSISHAIVAGETDFSFLSYALNQLFGVLLIFTFYNLYRTEKDTGKLLHYYLLSMSIFVFFFVYYYYSYFIQGVHITTLPFTDLLPLNLIESTLYSGTAAGFPRLSLPINNPPHISQTIAIAIIILIGYFVYCRMNRLGIIISLVLLYLVMFSTVSRSGIFALFITIGLIILLTLSMDKQRAYFLIKLHVVLFVILLFIYFVMDVRDMVNLTRLVSLDLVESRHFAIRMEGLEYIFSDIGVFLFGIGFRQTGVLMTETNAHLHSSYLTVFLERGLIGFLMTFYIYILVLVRLIRLYFSQKDMLSFILLNSFICLLIGNLFYEFMHILPAWILLAASSVHLANYEKKV